MRTKNPPSGKMATFTEQQFQQLLSSLTTAIQGITNHVAHPPEASAADPTKHFDTLAGRITPFSYDPEADVTFEAWYRRHEDIFTVDASSLDEPSKVRLLLHKLDAVSYEKFSNYVLPRTPKEVSFDQAVKTLKDLFGPQQSLFSVRYACMKLVKNPRNDFATYAGHVNRECAKFKLSECNDNQFKYLIFVCGLQSPEDAFVRLKLLDKIEADPNCTIQTLTEECKRLLNLRHDTKMIEEGRPTVHSIDAPPSPRRQKQQLQPNSSQSTQESSQDTPFTMLELR